MSRFHADFMASAARDHAYRFGISATYWAGGSDSGVSVATTIIPASVTGRTLQTNLDGRPLSPAGIVVNVLKSDVPTVTVNKDEIDVPAWWNDGATADTSDTSTVRLLVESVLENKVRGMWVLRLKSRRT